LTGAAQGLYSHLPVLGPSRRAAAIRALAAAGTAGAIDRLIEAAVSHPEPAARTACFDALAALGRGGNALAREAILSLAVQRDYAAAVDLALAEVWAPREPRQRAVFFFLTAQWSRYDDVDFDHTLIRNAYDLAGPDLRARLAAAARAGGRMEWLLSAASARGGGSRRASALGLGEGRAILEWLAVGRRWDDLARLAMGLPPMLAARAHARLLEAGVMAGDPDSTAALARLGQLAQIALRPAVDPPPPFTRETEFALWHKGDLFVLPQPSGRHGFGFSRDGASLVSPSPQSDRVAVWHLPSGHWREYLCARSAVSPDGGSLATVEEGRISIRNIPTDYVFSVWQLSEPPSWLRYTADGAWLVAVIRGKVLARRMTAGANGYVEEMALPAGDPGHGVTLCADGRMLVTAALARGVAQAWRVPAGVSLGSWACAPPATPETPAWVAHPDGDALVIPQDAPGRIRLQFIRPTDGELLQAIDWPGAGLSFSGAFSRDGLWLAGRAGDSAVMRAALFDVLSGRPVQAFEAPLIRDTDRQWLLTSALSADGRWLAVREQNAERARSEDLHRGGSISIWRQDGDRTRLKALLRSPPARAGWSDLAWLQSGVASRWTPGEAAWADYLEALLKRRHEHDIELADAPRHLDVGEFDIEIDG
jgi:hypothetical protein